MGQEVTQSEHSIMWILPTEFKHLFFIENNGKKSL